MYYRIFSASAHGPSVPSKRLSLITLGRVTGYYEDLAACKRLHLLAVGMTIPATARGRKEIPR
jgi:hypothetical protein